MVLKWNNDNLGLPGPFLGVSATSAEPLLWASARTAGEVPLFTRSRVGNGTAYAFTAAESALAEQPDLLRYLWAETIGEPLWKIEVNPQRYLVRIRRQKQRYVMHVIESRTTPFASHVPAPRREKRFSLGFSSSRAADGHEQRSGLG